MPAFGSEPPLHTRHGFCDQRGITPDPLRNAPVADRQTLLDWVACTGHTSSMPRERISDRRGISTYAFFAGPGARPKARIWL